VPKRKLDRFSKFKEGDPAAENDGILECWKNEVEGRNTIYK